MVEETREPEDNAVTEEPAKRVVAVPSDAADLSTLIEEVRRLIVSARREVVSAVSVIHATTCFEIGRRIVEEEQRGERRATYGAAVLKTLSERLTAEFGRGFSKRNLEYMRRFYLEFGERDAPIAQMPSAQSSPFALSWSQYVFLLSIPDTGERRFYEIESAANHWDLPELKRQFDSGLYERLALSRNPERRKALHAEGHTLTAPQDMLKDPLVLEFLGLDQQAGYSESDLESAILTHLERFLLELGKGFLFEARQKRFTFDADHFFVDLVFYNRLLRCYVLIDLKIGKLTHQDLGQMQMYVNYFDRYVRIEGEAPTVGIVLCKMKNDALVELTLPADANIYASRYLLYLPSKEELKAQLLDWTEEQIIASPTEGP